MNIVKMMMMMTMNVNTSRYLNIIIEMMNTNMSINIDTITHLSTSECRNP
jgi:hypothetical protein